MCDKCPPGFRVYKDFQPYREFIDACVRFCAQTERRYGKLAGFAVAHLLTELNSVLARCLSEVTTDRTTADELVNRLYAQIAMKRDSLAEMGRSGRRGERVDGVVEILNNIVVGTGGRRLPADVVYSLNARGVYVPDEFVE